MSSHSYPPHHLTNLILRITTILSLLLAILAFLPAQAAQVSTIWTICASGCNYTTVKEAIASASVVDGDTIRITEAVHTEDSIEIYKRITLEGLGREATILQAAAAPSFYNNYLLDTYGGKPVTIRNMTLRNGGSQMISYWWATIAIMSPTTLDNLLITQNYYQEYGFTAKGGAIYATAPLTVTNCIIRDNIVKSDVMAAGGGLYADSDADVKISNSTISNNQALGATVENGSGTTPQAMGGGIYVMKKITIQNSTISGNAATGGNVTNGTAGRAFGGGISSTMVVNSVFTITNSTISGNIAAGGDGPTDGSAYGGGLALVGGTLNFTTVVSNTTSGNLHQGGGVYYFTDWEATVNLKNSIFGDNQGPSGANGPDLYGIFTSQDYNLIETTSGYTLNGSATHDLIDISPNLYPLGDNGGDTQTHAPRPYSPIINSISSGENGCTPGATIDQVYKKRPIQSGCERGAYELPWRLYLPVVLR